MRLYYIWWRGSKRAKIWSREGCSWEVMKVKGSNRRFSFRSVMATVLVVGVILPFVFISAAFLALQGASKCSSSSSAVFSDCLGLRFGPEFLRGSDTSMKLGNELRKAFLEGKEAATGTHEVAGIDASLQSFEDLVAHISSNRQDIKTFVSMAKHMLLKMERRIHSAKLQGLIYKQLASIGIPTSLHCLSLRLSDEYSINSQARMPLPPPEHISRISDPSYHHIVLLTDNVLAAFVVVSSTVRSSSQPGKLVFHVITDKKTYAPMHAMFALNAVGSAMVEVKGLQHFDWTIHVSTCLMEMMEFHGLIREHYYYYYHGGGEHGRLEALRPKHFSLLNYMRIYLPEVLEGVKSTWSKVLMSKRMYTFYVEKEQKAFELEQLFPKLEKIVFLEDDVVVQSDLSPLWAMHLEGKVNGAVSSQDVRSERSGCLGGRYRDHLNFSNPLIPSELDRDRCVWLYGMNVFDLQAWRRSNITNTYHHWLKLNVESGFTLWLLGELPPALVAFHGHVHAIDPSWHVSGLGLGHPLSALEQKMVGEAAVLHFSGPAKPWLEIGPPQLRILWRVHVNFSNEYIRSCSIIRS